MTEWYLRCPTCGKTGRAAERGVVRIGAASVGKRTISWCSGCRRPRWIQIVRMATATGDGGPDRVWFELLAYVAEGSITTEVAERLYLADATPERRSEAAAQVASGALTPEAAIRLLSLPEAVASGR